jgi:hypothetical protein
MVLKMCVWVHLGIKKNEKNENLREKTEKNEKTENKDRKKRKNTGKPHHTSPHRFGTFLNLSWPRCTWAWYVFALSSEYPGSL